jgi:hypothetical protein
MTHESVDGVVETLDWYGLIEDDELVPGERSISIMYGGSVLAKRTYKVVARSSAHPGMALAFQLKRFPSDFLTTVSFAVGRTRRRGIS